MVKGIIGIINKTLGKPCSCPEGRQCTGCKKKHQTYYRKKPQVIVEAPKILPVPIKISKHREKSPKSFRFPQYKSKKTWSKQTTEENNKVQSKGRFSRLVTSLKTSKEYGYSKDKTLAKEYDKWTKEDKKSVRDYGRWKKEEDRKSVREYETWRREEEKIKQELALEKAQREKEAELLEQIKRKQSQQEKLLKQREEQLLEQLRKQQQKEQEQAEKAERDRQAILEKLAKAEAEKCKETPKNDYVTYTYAPKESSKSKKDNKKMEKIMQTKKIREEPVAKQESSEIIQPTKKPKKVKPAKEKSMKKSKVAQEEVRYKTIKRIPFKTRMSNCFYRVCCEFYCWMTVILLVGLLVVLLI